MPHLHALLLDGVYTPDAGFHAFRAPDEAHLRSLCETLRKRILKMLGKCGALAVDDEEDALLRCAQLSLFPPARGEEGEEPAAAGSRHKLAVDLDGFNLEGTTTIAPGDHAGRERLLRYLLRPPLSLERLSIDDNGLAHYELKKPDRRGRTELLFQPHELLARMTAQIPAPRLCLRRVFGVLAPGSPLREKVVAPRKKAVPPAEGTAAKVAQPPTRTPWAELLRHAFQFDPTRCSCGGTMRVVAVVRSRQQARRYLTGMGLYPRLPGELLGARTRPP